MDEFKKFYLKAVYFLKYRPRSEKEVRDKLIEKKAPKEIIDQVIQKLIEQRFLNDREFAQMWYRSRMALRPKSQFVIKRELIQKGIGTEIIEELLANKEDQKRTDLEQAKKLLEKQAKKYAGLPQQEQYQKLGAFLGRRGFDWDTIRQVIDEHFKLQYNSK